MTKQTNKIYNMEFLREFANHSAYEAAKNGLSSPNVSTCVQEDDVHYVQEIEVNPYVILRGKSVTWETSTYEMTICNYNGDAGYITPNEFEKIIVDGVDNEDARQYGEIMFENDTESTQHEIKFKLTGNTLPAYCFSEIGVGEDYVITVPNTVTNIGMFAFSSSEILKAITLSNSIIYICQGAFGWAENLESVTIEATTPPQLEDASMGFGEPDYNQFAGTTCTIYVPAESVNAYKAAEGWSTYADRIQAIS